MKPVLLKFSGINSYETEYSVAFEELTKGGIFGIFGPTGSGKSTILDAITLALYGKVPRYIDTMHRTFINTSSASASVELEFEIAIAGIKKRYIVKRGYKQNPKGKPGVSITYCSLAEVNGDILADRKENEVTMAVAGLVGLNYQDFTRSVFLPQGKFSEFIFLKGADREKMLERLFGLEEFGKNLQAKIKTAEIGARNELDICNMQIGFYGDISPDVLNTKKKLEKEMSDKIRTLSLERELFLSAWEKYKALDGAYTKLKAADLQLTEQKSLEESYYAEKLALEAAVRAEKLRIPIETIKSLQSQAAHADSERIKHEEIAEVCRKEAVKFENEYSEAKRAATEEYPELFKLEQKLELHLTAIKEIGILDSEVGELRSDWKFSSGQLSDFEKNYKNIKESHKLLADRASEIAAEKEKLIIPSEVFKNLNEGARMENEFTRNESNIRKNKQELTKYEKLSGDLRSMLEEILDEMAELSKRKVKSIASDLAKSLSDNSPCPVCGSLHHPNPQEAGLDFEQDEYLGNLENQAEKLKLEYTQSQARLESAANTLKDMQGIQDICVKSLNNLRAVMPGITDFSQALEEAFDKNTRKSKLEAEEAVIQPQIDKKLAEIQENEVKITKFKADIEVLLEKGREKAAIIAEKKAALGEYHNLETVLSAINETKLTMANIIAKEKEMQSLKDKHAEKLLLNEKNLASLTERISGLRNMESSQQKQIDKALFAEGFADMNAAEEAMMDSLLRMEAEERNREFYRFKAELENTVKQLKDLLGSEEDLQNISERLHKSETQYREADAALITFREEHAVLMDDINRMGKNLQTAEKLAKERKLLEARHGIIKEIENLFRANAFIKFLAAHQLRSVTAEATARLKRMTAGQYAIECDEDANFYIRDDFAGGAYRPPASLSGGEAFMTSLCLALALSTKIQMKSPADLSFFFLDEGFGSLDRETLDVVIDALEQLREENMIVGLITHVEEMKNRIINKIELERVSGSLGK